MDRARSLFLVEVFVGRLAGHINAEGASHLSGAVPAILL